MSNVCNCYEDGDGMAEDVNKTEEWYTKAAAQGSESAQTQLDKLNAQRTIISCCALKLTTREHKNNLNQLYLKPISKD